MPAIKSVPVLYRSFILIFLFNTAFVFFAAAQVSDSTAQQPVMPTGFFGVRAVMYITIPNPEKLLLDSLLWQRQKILRHSYEGKRVKQMLYQKSTDRIVVFLGGNKGLEMNKATAINEGFLAPEPEKKVSTPPIWSYLPKVPRDFYVDSPLYVGIKNYVSLNFASSNDIVIPYPKVDISPAGTDYNYIITVTSPGRVDISFADSATKIAKCIYHFIAKRLPGDDLAVLPDVQLGNIKTLAVKKQLLMAQNEMKVSNGYSFVSAVVYFAGPAFRDVITTGADTKLTYAKCYMDLCTPGCDIVFDNVMIKDNAGKLYNVPGFSIKVIEDSISSDEPVDYYSQSSRPEFPGGDDLLELMVNQELSKTRTDSIAPGQYNVGFVIKVDADGEVSAPCANELTRMTAIQKKCFDIIKDGPQWIPGKFKAINTPMAAGVSLKVEIK